MTVVDRDLGYRDYLKRMRGASAVFEVGILKPRSTMSHPSSRGLTLGQLAEIHEEGRGVPARPFASGYWRAREPEIDRLTLRMARSIHNGTPPKTAHTVLGRALVAGMRGHMAMVGPPLSASTVRAKGSGRRLYETGALWRAIDYKVTR